MRGKKASKRKVNPDPRFGSTTVERLVNFAMLHGKKSSMRDFVYEGMDMAAKKLKKEPIDVLVGAIQNIKPSLEIRSRRVGGANYQVPMPVEPERQEALALRWLVKVARQKKGRGFSEVLAEELLKAFNGEGDAVRIKTDTEKMAEANKAFAHFRW